MRATSLEFSRDIDAATQLFAGQAITSQSRVVDTLLDLAAAAPHDVVREELLRYLAEIRLCQAVEVQGLLDVLQLAASACEVESAFEQFLLPSKGSPADEAGR